MNSAIFILHGHYMSPRAAYSLKSIRQRDLKFSQTRQIFLGLVILNQKNLTQYAGILDSPFGNL